MGIAVTALIITWLIVFLFAVSFIGMVIQRERRRLGREQELRQRGVTVKGRIIQHRRESREEDSHYYLVYEYEYQGSSYKQKQSVNSRKYMVVIDGDIVDVLFLPENPVVSRLAPLESFRA